MVDTIHLPRGVVTVYGFDLQDSTPREIPQVFNSMQQKRLEMTSVEHAALEQFATTAAEQHFSV
ncbi:unnamed protein product [Ixodes pacificus]